MIITPAQLYTKFNILVLLMVLFSSAGYAEQKTTDFYAEAGKANLTALWHAPKIYFVGAPGPWDDFPEPLGFIGSSYQRFYIHSKKSASGGSNFLFKNQPENIYFVTSDASFIT